MSRRWAGGDVGARYNQHCYFYYYYYYCCYSYYYDYYYCYFCCGRLLLPQCQKSWCVPDTGTCWERVACGGGEAVEDAGRQQRRRTGAVGAGRQPGGGAVRLAQRLKEDPKSGWAEDRLRRRLR